jgi:DNA-3-methyladenine glycosylase I
VTRCRWAEADPLLRTYHDTEWGLPVHDDRVLFEYLLLDLAQAGLSWLTILRKREGYRELFAGFDPERVTRFTPEDVARLLADPRIIRNRAKIEAAVSNAERFLDIREEFGSFDSYVWRFVGGRTMRNRWESDAEVPSVSPEAEALSRDLRCRGFRFAGPVICYAFMQSAGLVNDHVTGCFRYGEV